MRTVSESAMIEHDDDTLVEIRTALLAKNDMLALLGLKTSSEGGLIVRVDPRQPVPTAQTYEDAASATRWFKRSLATSRKNGWVLLYDGEPLIG